MGNLCKIVQKPYFKVSKNIYCAPFAIQLLTFLLCHGDLFVRGEAKEVRIAKMFLWMSWPFNGNYMWINLNYCYLFIYFLNSYGFIISKWDFPKMLCFRSLFPHCYVLFYALLPSFTTNIWHDLLQNHDLLHNQKTEYLPYKCRLQITTTYYIWSICTYIHGPSKSNCITCFTKCIAFKCKEFPLISLFKCQNKSEINHYSQLTQSFYWKIFLWVEKVVKYKDTLSIALLWKYEFKRWWNRKILSSPPFHRYTKLQLHVGQLPLRVTWRLAERIALPKQR